MPTSLRIPTEKEKMIIKAASKEGKTKTAFILDAVYEKLGIKKPRKQLIREQAGWLSHEDAEMLRNSMAIFSETDEDDWR